MQYWDLSVILSVDLSNENPHQEYIFRNSENPFIRIQHDSQS